MPVKIGSEGAERERTLLKILLSLTVNSALVETQPVLQPTAGYSSVQVRMIFNGIWLVFSEA
jgi:hypothetical protein